jgi:membrane AbrB-like protein
MLFWGRAALTLLLALAAAQVCVWLHTPIPWMLGPLLATAVASVLGAPTRSAALLRNAGQWVIGAALGLYFTPQVSELVVSLWWAIALAVLWALGLGALFGAWLQRQHAADFAHLPPGAWRATSYFASAIGGASEMTLLAERHRARTDLVAAAHSVRLVIVVVSVPFAMQWAQNHWGLQVDARLLPGPRVAQWPGLLWLALATRGRGPVHDLAQAHQSVVHGRFAGVDGADAFGGVLVGGAHGFVKCGAAGHWRESGGALSA